MEFLEGQALDERLQKGPLPLTQVLEYGAQITDALGAAHKRGIVHRDLKPNNIIQAFNQNYAGKLTPHGQALVSAGLFTEAQLKALGAVIPSIPLVPTGNPSPWHNVFTTDVRIDRPINLSKIHEGVSVRPCIDVFNLFNHNPRALYGGLTGRFGQLNYDYAKAGNSSAADLASAVNRLGGLGRHLQFGFRVIF